MSNTIFQPRSTTPPTPAANKRRRIVISGGTPQYDTDFIYQGDYNVIPDAANPYYQGLNFTWNDANSSAIYAVENITSLDLALTTGGSAVSFENNFFARNKFFQWADRGETSFNVGENPISNVLPAAADAPELNIISTLVAGIAKLLNEDDYDEEFIKPTNYTISRALELIFATASTFSSIPTQGKLSTDGMGGIRMEWKYRDKEIRAVISATAQGRSYIYYEQNDTYDIDTALSGTHLSYWLSWLIT